MTKTEHLQFLVLMIPTILILVAGAVFMADLHFRPTQPPLMSMPHVGKVEELWHFVRARR